MYASYFIIIHHALLTSSATVNSLWVLEACYNTINIQGSNTCESLPDISAIGDDVIWITYELQATVLKK